MATLEPLQLDGDVEFVFAYDEDESRVSVKVGRPDWPGHATHGFASRRHGSWDEAQCGCGDILSYDVVEGERPVVEGEDPREVAEALAQELAKNLGGEIEQARRKTAVNQLRAAVAAIVADPDVDPELVETWVEGNDPAVDGGVEFYAPSLLCNYDTGRRDRDGLAEMAYVTTTELELADDVDQLVRAYCARR